MKGLETNNDNHCFENRQDRSKPEEQDIQGQQICKSFHELAVGRTAGLAAIGTEEGEGGRNTVIGEKQVERERTKSENRDQQAPSGVEEEAEGPAPVCGLRSGSSDEACSFPTQIFPTSHPSPPRDAHFLHSPPPILLQRRRRQA
jgi:hypothetical protein